MTNNQTGAKPFDGVSPYVHWFHDFEQPKSSPLENEAVATLSLTVPAEETPPGDGVASTMLSRLQERFGDKVPLPKHAVNPDFAASLGQKRWLPDGSKMPKLEGSPVIVGVIDTGIALGHRRFTDKEGGTRILAAWQQIGDRTKTPCNVGDCTKTPYHKDGVPFGFELYQSDIDALQKMHRVNGWLDEHEFNIESGSLDMRNRTGNRELAGRFSHGTHVLDAAAGFDPYNDEAGLAERLPIIAVNLPTSATFDVSGTFLDYFVILAIRRIVDLADAIWLNSNEEPAEGETIGYPLVINISFGRQAGSKDLLDFFPAELERMHQQREADHRSPFHVVMPVGNDNLLQCNARMVLSKDQPQSLSWRLLPEDQTANYVEVWSDHQLADGVTEASQITNPLAVALIEPEGDIKAAQTVAGQHGHFTEIGDFARIYCEIRVDSQNNSYHVRYVICMAPTLRQSGTDGKADWAGWSPAGRWTIKLENLDEVAKQLPNSVCKPTSPSCPQASMVCAHTSSGRTIRSMMLRAALLISPIIQNNPSWDTGKSKRTQHTSSGRAR